jgi:hypothetical protein
VLTALVTDMSELFSGPVDLRDVFGVEKVNYGDARWTSSDETDAANLMTPEFDTFAKSAAFASYDSATRVLLVAGGFSGANANGEFRSFEFVFAAADTPANLMFTTTSAMSWNSSYEVWRSTFGQDRTSPNPMFQRGGSSANQTIALDRAVLGCGTAMMFGFQARDGGADVNSGLGINADFCGGNAGRGFAGGNWMGNYGSVQIWMK